MRNSTEKTRINFNRNSFNIKTIDNNSNKFLDTSKFNNTIMSNRSNMTNRSIMTYRSRNNNENSPCNDFRFNSTTRRYIFGNHSMNYEKLKPNSDNVLKDYRYDSMRMDEKKEKEAKEDLNKNLIENLEINLKNNSGDVINNLNEEIKSPIINKPVIIKDRLDEIFEREYDHLSSTNKNYFIRTVKKKKLESIHPESQTKVYIHNQSYNSPIRSFSTIKKNEVIFGSMVKNYHEVQKHKYINFLQHADESAIINKPDFRKVKVSTMIKKKNKFKEISETEEKENMIQEEQNQKEKLQQEKNCKIFFIYFI